MSDDNKLTLGRITFGPKLTEAELAAHQREQAAIWARQRTIVGPHREADREEVTLPAGPLRVATDWGEGKVGCDQNCGALENPITLEEVKAALEHWKVTPIFSAARMVESK